MGRGRESFEFFEIMDEFLGCSDKVRPKFVKQTQLLENKKNGESENMDTEEAPKDLEVVENCKDRVSPAQQESSSQSEERDKEAIQAMMKFQADSERRHQEFMVSVLGKLGDIFSSKNKI
ncbi:hypothetical protein P5673_026957 [Acropora cervicornis]|uniref:Uncharacterized protein n=1 Tax=Acropora cervicornis TaxID=6130 RepID=A0AAD9Q011_ACRCE|nr:hypothetical protein P5673_026957 [Acropora cervicornis]